MHTFSQKIVRTSMHMKNAGGKWKNLGPDEETGRRLGAQKYLCVSEVLAKCHFREDYDPKSLVNCNEIEISALVEVWSRMNSELPVCVKYVHRSQATRSGLMNIPASFSRRYLPVVDTVMTLETENGDLYKAKYLPRQSAFSGGWGRFAVCEKLVRGDLAIFYVVGATRIKVYIIKKGSSTVELPTYLLNLCKKAAENVLDGNELIVYNRRHGNENCRNPEKVKINFDNITGFEDFKIVIDNLLQNHDLSEGSLQAYYKLCRSQNAFLHENLLKGLSSKFLAEVIRSIISTTVDISIALRTCTLSTFLDNVSQWGSILKNYEAVGINVGFLSSRLHQLENLAVNSEGAVSRRRYIEACHERPRCEHELQKLKTILAMWKKISNTLSIKVKALESKGGYKEYTDAYFRLGQAQNEIREIKDLIAELCKFFEHYDSVIETLKTKANLHELEFQQKVDAPW
ncbi:hypothetical protein vseg_019392 [Gypsophila vaccaria]